MRSCRGRTRPFMPSALTAVALAIFLYALTGSAAADWSPPLTVTESGSQPAFGQDVGPAGEGLVAWSASSPDGYTLYAREVASNNQAGGRLTLSDAPAGAAFTTAYAPTVRYLAAGVAIVVWMESSYGSNSCFTGSASSGEDCVVDEYVRSRRVAGGVLSPVRTIQHRQVTYPAEGPFGGTAASYVTYGQPELAAGPKETLTLVWPESTFAEGCAAYGYAVAADAECEADERLKWARLLATAEPAAAPAVLYEGHTTGYGSGSPLLHLRAGAAGDGTATVVFSARSEGASSCWGGESSLFYLRISPAGATTAATRLDSNCGSTVPDLAVDGGGTAVAVWGWTGAYSDDEALYSRINATGEAETPKTLLDDGSTHISGLDVAHGASGSALAVWAAEGSLHSRRLPAVGQPGPEATIAVPPSGHYFFSPRLAVAPDGSAAVAWEDALVSGGSGDSALQGINLAADGTPDSQKTLLAASGHDHGLRVTAAAAGTFMAAWRISVPRHNRIQTVHLDGQASASNDNFADPQPLDSELPSFTSGSNVGATAEPGEPSHAGRAAGASVWFEWTPVSSGPVTLSTCASTGLDPLLAVYTGSSLGSLTTVAAAAAGAPRPCSEGDSGVRFDAVAGVTYRIAVDGENGTEGSFGLKVLAREKVPANDDFAAPRQINTESSSSFGGSNTDASKEPAEPDHEGDAGGASVWYSWTPTRSAPTTLWACGQTLQAPTLGVYTGSSLASLTSVGERAAAPAGCEGGSTVRLQAVAGTTYRIAVDGKGGSEGRFQLRLVQKPANDDFSSAKPVGGGGYVTLYGSTAGASKEPGEPNHAGDAGGASVWYSWTPGNSGTEIISACLFAWKETALLAVYRGANVGSLTEVAAAAGGGSVNGCGNPKSTLRFHYEAGITYMLAVDTPGGTPSDFSLEMKPVPFNDDFAKAEPITGSLPRTLSSFNSDATKEPGEPNHAGDPGGASVWYSWTPPSAGGAVISACSYSGSSPLLAVYRGPDVSDLKSVAADSGSGAKNGCTNPESKVGFEAQEGVTYYIAIDSKGGIGSFFTLKLDLETTPANDSFATPRAVGQAPVTLTANNRHASKEPGEPNHAGDPGGASVWFSWTPSQSGDYGISTCSSGPLDPLLAVYTGSSLGGLGEVASSDNGNPANCSADDGKVRIAVTAGTTYRIAVDGKGGTTGSFELEISPPPANDDFDHAELIPESLPAIRFGSTHLATKEPGEPNHAGDPGGASVWYSWTATRSRPVRVSACSFTSLQPLLGVYSGSSVSSLQSLGTVKAATTGECSGEELAITFAATAGTTYHFAVDAKNAADGSFRLTVRGRPLNDDFADASQLDADLPDYSYGESFLATKQTGEPNHAGDPGGASVWYSWTPSSTGYVSISTCSYGVNGLDPLLAVYSGSSLASLETVAADDNGKTECSPQDSEVRFIATSGTTYYIAVDGKGGGEGSFELDLSAPPGNDNFADATPLTGDLPLEAYGSNRAASKEPGEPNHAGDPGGASVWYSWTAPTAGGVRISTCSSAYDDLDPLLAVYSGSSLDGLTPVAADDNGTAGCSAEDSKVQFTAVAGTTYYIAVDGKGGGEGNFQLALHPLGPANDDLQDAIEIPQAPGFVDGTNFGAGTQPGESQTANQTVWYRMHAQENGIVRLHTCSDHGAAMALSVFTDNGSSSPGGLGYVAAIPSQTTNACGSAPGIGYFSRTPSAAFQAVAGTTYFISVDRYLQFSPSFELQPAGPFRLVVDPPANDLRGSAERVPTTGASLDRSNLGATHEAGEEEHAGNSGGGSVWFRWFASASGPVTIDTCGSSIDTLLSAEDEEGEEVAAADDSAECGPGSTAAAVSFEAEEGVDYRIAVDGKDGATGAFHLHVLFNTPDTTPPETAAQIPIAVNSSQLYFLAFRDEPQSSFECALDGAPFAPCEVVEDGIYTRLRVSGLAEGDHQLAVREVDLAGNADPTPEVAHFKVDTIPPQTSFFKGPQGLTRLLGPFQFASSEEGSSFQCGLDGGPMSFCQSPYSLPSSLPDGDHVLEVSAVDVAGNQDASPATRAFHLDRTAPVASIESGPVGTVSNPNATFAFSANESATFECGLDEELAPCTTPRLFPDLNDGEHTFSVRATDAAGNLGEEATRTFRVEARPPQTTIEAGPPARTPLDSAHFEFAADEEVEGFECSLDEAEFSECESTLDLSGVEEGPHLLKVRAVDRAGKQDPTPAEQSWIVDTRPPQTTIVSGPSGETAHRGPFKFAADEEVGGFECALDEGEFSACESGYSIPAVADGEHTLRVRAVDLAGNPDPTPAERSLWLDTTPPSVQVLLAPAPVGGSEVTVEFEVEDESGWAECNIDFQAYFDCASPVTFEGIPDGPHTIHVRGADRVGNVGTPVALEFTVDEVPPETYVDEVPEFVGSGPATLHFHGSADAKEFECALDGGGFDPCTSPTAYEGLEEGPHEFAVRAIDEGGNVDPTPAEATFVVDRTPPETTIVEGPEGPVHAPSLPFRFESSEQPASFECALDDGPFVTCAGITHEYRIGEHTLSARAVDRAGNADPSPATYPFTVVNQEPVPHLAISNVSGPAPLRAVAGVSGDDADGDPLGFELQWGDGSIETGSAPATGLAHVYKDPGVYVVRLQVDDGFGPVATTQVVSVSEPEPLQADAGDDLTAVAGEPITLDGANSRPFGGIDTYRWLFSDGAEGSGEAFTRAFAAPGDYQAQLVVSGVGGTSTDTTTVHVLPKQQGPTTTVHVHDGGIPLAEAGVLIQLGDGRRIEGRTDGDGNASLPGVPDGAYKVYAQKEGYVPGIGDLEVEEGSGSGDVALAPGATASVDVESKRMTLSEIEAAGIDTSNPDNLHVYRFSIGAKLVGYASRGGFSGPGCSEDSCTFTADGNTYVNTLQWVGDVPIVNTLKIPAKATFLKEFFNITVTVTNLAAPGITLQHGHAEIHVPSGMSLAPTAVRQGPAVAVPDIPGGGSTTLHWTLRGDVEGEYGLGVSYGAVLEPFGTSFRAEGHTVKPIKVWGGSAVHLEVDLDEEGREGYPYTAFVKLKDVADIPVYNTEIEFLQSGHVGYIEQPRQRRRFAARELEPGETLTAGPFIIVPQEGGVVDLARSLVRKIAGDVELGATVVTHKRSPSFDGTPAFRGRWRNDKDLVLEWGSVSGASGYEIYQTPDRKTEFGSVPVTPVHQFSPTKVMVEADRSKAPLFAISSIIGGERKMVHPLLDTAAAPLAEYPSIVIEDLTTCGEAPTAKVTFEDPDFELTGWGEGSDEKSAVADHPLNKHEFSSYVHGTRPGVGRLAPLAVAVKNSNPGDGTKKGFAYLGNCGYVGLGDSFSSGEGAVAPNEPYDEDNHCHRSPHAYAHQLADRREDVILETFKACSGAVTHDLFNVGNGGDPPQSQWVPGADLVTLSIGGNDLGFSNVLKGCIATHLAQIRSLIQVPCKLAAAPYVTSHLNTLEVTLPPELEDLHDDMGQGGRLILVGYPQIFPSSKPFRLSACDLIDSTDVTWMHEAVSQANTALAEIAKQAGVEFTDPNSRGRFDGHDVCSSDPYFNSLRIPELVESFHPNPVGHTKLMEAVEERLNDPQAGAARIEQGQSIFRTLTVTAANALIARIRWPGSDVELSLESPSGQVIDRGHVPDGVSHDLESTVESYLVPDPEPGEWKLRAKGLEVAEGGEPLAIELDQTEPTPEPPVALFEYETNEGPAPLKNDFDAGSSFDPSGQPLTYNWDFGDGSTGSGVHTSHTFGNVGEYTVKLTVEDSDGETDTFESAPIVVKAPSEEPGPPPPGETPQNVPPATQPSPGDPQSASASAPSPPVAPKAKKCKKGYKRKTVRGKARCVKPKRHHKRHHGREARE